MKRYLNNDSGFTLIELMVVTTILLIVLGGIGSFLVHNTQSFYNGRNEMEAQTQATLVMNRLANGIPGIAAGTGILASWRVSSVVIDGAFNMTNLSLVESDQTTVDQFVLSGNVLTFQHGANAPIPISSDVISVQVLPIHGTIPVNPPIMVGQNDYTDFGDGVPLTTGLQLTVTTQVPPGTGNTATITSQYWFRNTD